jgi:hypothetical protein
MGIARHRAVERGGDDRARFVRDPHDRP